MAPSRLWHRAFFRFQICRDAAGRDRSSRRLIRPDSGPTIGPQIEGRIIMNTARVLILYVVCLLVGQSIAVGLGIYADRFSSAIGIAVFIPIYYAMYWVAWRVALWIGDRSPEVVAATATATATADRSGRPPISAAVWLLAPATLTLELCD